VFTQIYKTFSNDSKTIIVDNVANNEE